MCTFYQKTPGRASRKVDVPLEPDDAGRRSFSDRVGAGAMMQIQDTKMVQHQE